MVGATLSEGVLVRLFRSSSVARRRWLSSRAGLVLNSLRLLELAAEGGDKRVTIHGDVHMEVKPLQSRRLRPAYRSL